MALRFPLAALMLPLGRIASAQSPALPTPPGDSGYVTGADGVRLFYSKLGSGVAGKPALPGDPAPVPDSLAMARLDSLEQSGWARSHPREYCEERFRVTRVALVGDPSKASRIESPCDMPNEWPVNVARHLQYHFGAIQRLDVPAESITKRVTVPVLTIHRTRDRNAPYAAGREWATLMPNARLLTIERAAQRVTLDAPGIVLPAIERFLAGDWPDGAERVTSLERDGPP